MTDSAFKLGGNRLRLHADPHIRHTALAVWLEGTSKETTEGGLASTVLAHHDNDFRVGELARIDPKFEIAERLLHLGVLESTGLVDGELVSSLGNTEGQRLVTESQVFRGNVTVEEDINTFSHRVWQGDHTVDGGLAVKHAHIIRKIIEDGQIVLNHNDVVIIAKKRADDGGSAQSLLDIKVGRRLVEHVNICLLDAHCANGETLELTTREQVHISVQNMVQLQDIEDLFHISKGGSTFDKVANALLGPTDSLGDLVHVLGLDDCFEVIFEKLGEVVCKTISKPDISIDHNISILRDLL